jgi:hypothetical protein
VLRDLANDSIAPVESIHTAVGDPFAVLVVSSGLFFLSLRRGFVQAFESALRLCTRWFYFALQRATALTTPSQSIRIPTWGREQARNRFVRCGLFLWVRWRFAGLAAQASLKRLSLGGDAKGVQPRSSLGSGVGGDPRRRLHSLSLQ